MRGASTRDIGLRAQHKAALWLQERGYDILAQNFRTALGEIDIVAGLDGVVVFVEVKYRKNTRYGMPREAVGRAKQRRIVLAAQEYISSADAPCDYRFDVIEMFMERGQMVINHIEGAFDLSCMPTRDYA